VSEKSRPEIRMCAGLVRLILTVAAISIRGYKTLLEVFSISKWQFVFFKELVSCDTLK